MRAVSFWQDQGIDLAGYTVRDMAADINDLRQALGYDTISLLGGSFGTHHGFALLREYGDVIDRAFLMGVEGPNHTIKLPSTVQTHLETLGQLLKDDPSLREYIPDLLDLMSSVLDRLERHPITVESRHPETYDHVRVTLGPYDAQLVTANGMGSTPFLRALPRRYLAMQHGDFSWLAEQVLRERLGVTSNLAYPAVDCASGATSERRRQIVEETPTTLLGNAINEPFHAFCEILGNRDLGDLFRSALRSGVPTVLVGGTLDVRTPIRNAEELLPHLSRGQLLTIEGVSHDLSIRGDHLDELRRCRDQFFRGETVTTQRLQSSFAFEPYEDGPQT
jgi:pimeloyl-ACP methyl ester carboxylesterase